MLRKMLDVLSVAILAMVRSVRISWALHTQRFRVRLTKYIVRGLYINQDFKEEVVKYTGNTEWIVNVNRKRDRLIADENKRHNDEIAAKNKQAAENAKRLKEENNRKLLTADKELYNAELTMMEDGLAKQLKTIRKSYEDRIRAAKENGAKVNEVVEALNKAMEKELQKAVDKTFEDLSKTASSLIKQVHDIKLENMLDRATYSAEKRLPHFEQ